MLFDYILGVGFLTRNELKTWTRKDEEDCLYRNLLAARSCPGCADSSVHSATEAAYSRRSRWSVFGLVRGARTEKVEAALACEVMRDV